MKDCIIRKLEQIEELFPPERIERSKTRWRSLWKGERPDDGYPFVYGNFLFSYYDDVHTPEERLRLTLDEICVRGGLHDDYVPSIFPGCRQSTIPGMFGAKEKIVGRDYLCERIIHDYKDIEKLPEPCIAPGTAAYGWLEMQKYFLDETGGRIPIHVTDMQGPVDVAGQLWGYDQLFIAAMEEPAYYHQLLTKLTKAFILFWKSQKEILGNSFIGTHLFGWDWIPEGYGATLSADSIVMVSPDFFDEFYKPYLDEIAKAFGDISIHSCGNFASVFRNLTALAYVKGIHASQMTIDQLLKAGLDNRIMVCAVSDIDSVDGMLDLIQKNSLRVDLTVMGLWPMGDGNSGLWPSPLNMPVRLDEMTPQLWDEVKRRDERMQELFIG